MIPPVLIFFLSFLCHAAIAGRTCPKPEELPFAVVVPLKSSYAPGEEIVYTCQPGYVSRGGIRRFICPLTGLWPINTLKCLPITCPPPPTPKFAKLSVYKPLAGNNSLYGGKAVFECLPQHAMFGNGTITCTEHGNWTELPECKGKPGPGDLGRMENGAVNSLELPGKAFQRKVLEGERRSCLQILSLSASCKLSVKRATVIYEGERVNIQDKFKNGMLHGQKISFFCKNKEKKCSYTEDAQCIDGTIEIPKCFKEHSALAFWKTDASDVKPC
uniref:Beta-2-glycoprotein 1 n=1 Tax=Sus scrofa TaxID=9823 RepID=A0A8D0XC61_PIG